MENIITVILKKKIEMQIIIRGFSFLHQDATTKSQYKLESLFWTGGAKGRWSFHGT